MKNTIRALVFATSSLAAASALADIVQSDTVIINGVNGRLCVGLDCADGETFFHNGEIKVKQTVADITFEDTSTASNPDRDWQLRANHSNAENFVIRDLTSGGTPFGVDGGAATGSLWVRSNGNVGLGTQLPTQELHILSSGTPTIRLEQDGTGGGVAYAWEFRANSANFGLVDAQANRTPFLVLPGAQSTSLAIGQNGGIGLGTSTPDGKLHTEGDGVQLVYFESTDGGPVQVRFRTDSQNRRFLAVNNANEVKSQIVFGDDQIQFLGETVAQEWLRVSSAGIVSSGPTCSPNPCDATFDPEAFTVPAIEERAALMWENMYLPAVGPTAPEAPFNVTEKMGGVIHELEVAHIYIEQLHDRLTAQETEIARASALEKQVKHQDAVIASLVSRLDAIEAQ